MVVRLPSPQRVLVVDDYEDGANTLALLVQVAGHEVRKANCGTEALSIAVVFLPTLVLLDIALPDLNGYEVAKRLRSDTRIGNVVIAALTGYGRETDRERAKLAGCDCHITKPIEMNALLDLLATLPPVSRS
jgi:CheY-like chemotaxis protein